MAAALRRGSASPEELAEAVAAEEETVKRTARRYPEQFTMLPGGRLGLKARA
jgi:hypothetical protein